jgi:hypothetical protein
VGPIGPIGLTGPQGVAGLNVPAGTIIGLASGTPAPAGYTFLGWSVQAIAGPAQKFIKIDVYQKY